MISKPEPGRLGPSVLRHRPGSTSSPPDPPRQRDQKRGILKGQNHQICGFCKKKLPKSSSKCWDSWQRLRCSWCSYWLQVRENSTGWNGWTGWAAVSFRDLIHVENHHVRLSERQNPRIGTPKLFKMRRNYDSLLNVSKSRFYSNQLPNSCSFSQFEPAICPNPISSKLWESLGQVPMDSHGEMPSTPPAWRPDALVRSSDSQILLAQLVLIGAMGRSGTGFTKSNTGILAANFHLIEQGSDEPSKYAFNIFRALNFWWIKCYVNFSAQK